MTCAKTLALGLAVLLVWGAAAQVRYGSGRALDSNLMAGSGGYNSRQQSVSIQRDVYQVNRRTGGMRYNQAAAFNAPMYSSWQRMYGRNPQVASTAPVTRSYTGIANSTGLAYRRPTGGYGRGNPYRANRAGGVSFDSTAAFRQPRYGAVDSVRRGSGSFVDVRPPAPGAGLMAPPGGLGTSRPYGTAPATFIQPRAYSPISR